MALIDKASLLMVPSTYEAGTLYNVLPSGNRAPDSTGENSGYDQTRADFTFDRGTNAAATRVNSDGLIEKYRENLLLQSNQLDTTWASASTTETSGQSGYDGSSNAWLLTSSSATSGRLSQAKSLSGVQTLSVYAKAGSLNWVRLYPQASTLVQAWFDLENGVVGTTSSNNIDAKIESVGDGWYRCSVTSNITLIEARIYPSSGDGVSGGIGSIYIQNAQLESGLVSTDYLDSGATTAKAGVLVDLPRINYDANGENGALLLEPQRANKVQYSEYIDGLGKYVNGDGTQTITNNYTTSPDGLKNASRLQCSITDDTSLSNSSMITLGTNVTPVGSNSISFYAKSLTGANQTIRVYWSYSGEDVTITPDWKRYNIDASVDNTSTVYIGTRGGSGSYAAGGDVNLDFALWGLQVEQGASYGTSYIPNHGESGGVTRAADAATLDITNLVGASEGTLFFELKDAKSHSATNKILGIGDGSGVDNFFGLYVSNFETGAVGIRNRQGNADLMNTAIPDPQNAKVAIKFGASGVKTFLNGSEFQTSATAYTGWATSFDLNTSFGDVDLKQYLLFDTALTDAECETLTTL